MCYTDVIPSCSFIVIWCDETGEWQCHREGFHFPGIKCAVPCLDRRES